MLLGHWIEMRSISQAQGALKELAKLLPDIATRIVDGKTEEVPVSEISPSPRNRSGDSWHPARRDRFLPEQGTSGGACPKTQHLWTTALMISRLLPLVSVLLLTACGGSELPPAQGESTGSALGSEPPAAASVASLEELPHVVVYKTPSCGCCNGWVEHLREAGFDVEARDVRDLMSVKIDAGVPTDLTSCHTALIDGYVVEGHIPADVVKRLLAERPAVAGIAVPGMPIGSPGMEGPNPEAYTVQAFTADGDRATFAEVDPRGP